MSEAWQLALAGLGLSSALGVGGWLGIRVSSQGEHVAALESQVSLLRGQLERLEGKLDRLLERT